MEKGIRRGRIIGLIAAVLVLICVCYWGFLQYLKLPEKDLSGLREEFPVAERDYAGVSLNNVRDDYTAVVLCRLKEVLTPSQDGETGKYLMEAEGCLWGQMGDQEFVLCINGLPKEEEGTLYLLFAGEMPPEWNVEKGYSAPEEWIYYVTEEKLLLSAYTSDLWQEKGSWNPAAFDGCSVDHFIKYLEWIF